jgi:agmatinase
VTIHHTSRNASDQMDPPFVGLAPFARLPACPDWDKFDAADVAVIGVPIDTCVYRKPYRVDDATESPKLGE